MICVPKTWLSLEVTSRTATKRRLKRESKITVCTKSGNKRPGAVSRGCNFGSLRNKNKRDKL